MREARLALIEGLPDHFAKSGMGMDNLVGCLDQFEMLLSWARLDEQNVPSNGRAVGPATT